MRQTESGKMYFKLDGTIESKERLISFLETYGFSVVKWKPLGISETYNRVTELKHKNGLTFDIVWFINLCHVRVGEWGKGILECDFNEITGAVTQWVDHDVLSFGHNGKKVMTLAVPQE